MVQPSYHTVRNPSAEKIVYATRDCILHNDGILACPSGCQAPKGMCQATSGDRYLGSAERHRYCDTLGWCGNELEGCEGEIAFLVETEERSPMKPPPATAKQRTCRNRSIR